MLILFGSAPTLTVLDAVQVQAADSVVVTEVHQLAVADAAQAHSADSATLTQAHNLTGQNALHAHTADTVTLTQVGQPSDLIFVRPIMTPMPRRVRG